MYIYIYMDYILVNPYVIYGSVPVRRNCENY